MGIDPDDLDRRLKRLFRPIEKAVVPVPADAKPKWWPRGPGAARRCLHLVLIAVPLILLVIGVIAVITGSV